MAHRLQQVSARGWPWLVMEDQSGGLLGYAYCAQFRDRAAYALTGETSVYVRAGQQGRGVGRTHLTALLAAGREVGFRQFIAVIGDSGNAASIRLHAALGFRHVGTLSGVGLKFGRLLDVVLMQSGPDSP
jgi:phosphinothricin acetyltransferase